MMWIWPENAHKNSSKFYSTNLPHDLSWRHVHRCEIIVHLFTRPFLCVYSSCCHGNACIWISTVEELSSRFFPRQGNTKYLKYFRNIYTNTFWLEKNLPTKNVEKKHIFFILSENSIFFIDSIHSKSNVQWNTIILSIFFKKKTPFFFLIYQSSSKFWTEKKIPNACCSVSRFPLEFFGRFYWFSNNFQVLRCYHQTICTNFTMFTSNHFIYLKSSPFVSNIHRVLALIPFSSLPQSDIISLLLFFFARKTPIESI